MVDKNLVLFFPNIQLRAQFLLNLYLVLPCISLLSYRYSWITFPFLNILFLLELISLLFLSVGFIFLCTSAHSFQRHHTTCQLSPHKHQIATIPTPTPIFFWSSLCWAIFHLFPAGPGACCRAGNPKCSCTPVGSWNDGKQQIFRRLPIRKYCHT